MGAVSSAICVAAQVNSAPQDVNLLTTPIHRMSNNQLVGARLNLVTTRLVIAVMTFFTWDWIPILYIHVFLCEGSCVYIPNFGYNHVYISLRRMLNYVVFVQGKNRA